MAKLSTDERKWRAESDFHTLAAAEAVKADRARMRAAQAAGKAIVQREQKALQAKQAIVKPAKKSSRAPAKRAKKR